MCTRRRGLPSREVGRGSGVCGVRLALSASSATVPIDLHHRAKPTASGRLALMRLTCTSRTPCPSHLQRPDRGHIVAGLMVI